MKIDSVTKYRCNGCGHEDQNPCGWSTVAPLLFGSWTVVVGSLETQTEDYCALCIGKMREVIQKAPA